MDPKPQDPTLKTQCAIVGGGPAGLMLSLLLARAGVDVTVIETHADFLRDFRGDTIHPSTLDIMKEIGLLEALLALPHTKAPRLSAEIGGQDVTIADFSRLPTACRFIAFMPQWDFLDFLARAGARYPNFHLQMGTAFSHLLTVDGRVTGLAAEGPEGEIRIEADLVVGADGRRSKVREAAGLRVTSFGSPRDVLWMKLSRRPEDPEFTMGHAGPRQGFVMIDRGDYWQCGYVLRRETFSEVRAAGLEAFRAKVAQVCPLPADRLQEIRDFTDVQRLEVRIDRLERWWMPGLLCIGDAAHAMSPIGGVGVNLAIQDAVAAANRLAEPLLSGRVTAQDLEAVQRRREFPTRMTQKLQLMMQKDRRKREQSETRSGPPAFLKGIARWPLLAHLAGRIVGLGFRREHVRTRPAR